MEYFAMQRTLRLFMYILIICRVIQAFADKGTTADKRNVVIINIALFIVIVAQIAAIFIY